MLFGQNHGYHYGPTSSGSVSLNSRPLPVHEIQLALDVSSNRATRNCQSCKEPLLWYKFGCSLTPWVTPQCTVPPVTSLSAFSEEGRGGESQQELLVEAAASNFDLVGAAAAGAVEAADEDGEICRSVADDVRRIFSVEQKQ